MSEHTSTISEMHDNVSTSTVFLVVKKKYATVKSTSKGLVIRTQSSSHSTPQITTATIPKGPQHSQGRSGHSSGLVVPKSFGSSPTKDE